MKPPKSLDYLYQKLDETFQDNVKLSISSLIESQLKKQTLAKVKDNYLVDPLDSPFIPEEGTPLSDVRSYSMELLLGLCLE